MSIAQQVIYSGRYIAAFERTKSILLPTVRTDTLDQGGSFVFLVAGSGGRSAVTRGSNGLIPPSDDSQTQVTLTMAEAHDLRELTNFDIFKAQDSAHQLEMMQNQSIGVIHRKQDAVIIAAIATGTVDLGAIGLMNKQVANRLVTILGNAEAAERGQLYALLSTAAFAELEDITSFASTDYSKTGGDMQDGIPSFGVWKHWMGINWAVHNGLTGIGTTAKCLAWNRNAVGYKMSTRGVDAKIGYDEKQDTSWRRASVFHGAVKLQNAGIVKFDHDDTALSS